MVRAADFVAILPRSETTRGVGGMMSEVKLSEELQKMGREPLLPVEKRLIAWSLGIGVILLALLVWLSKRLV